MIDLVENQVVRNDNFDYFFLFLFILKYLLFIEVCGLNSLIRSVLIKAEIKYEEKRKRAEQSDDSLEEDYEQTIDSLSDEDNNNNNEQDDLQILFNPIPQKQQM